MKPAVKVLLVALAAGTLGVIAGLWSDSPGVLLRSELGQRALNGALSASAPAPFMCKTGGLRIAPWTTWRLKMRQMLCFIFGRCRSKNSTT